MTKGKVLSAFLILPFALVACQTIAIKKAAVPDANAPKGIPFYIKTAACKHETIWLQPIYTLSLKTTFTQEKSDSSDKPEPLVSTRVVVLTLEQYQTTTVSDLFKAVSAGKVDKGVHQTRLRTSKTNGLPCK